MPPASGCRPSCSAERRPRGSARRCCRGRRRRRRSPAVSARPLPAACRSASVNRTETVRPSADTPRNTSRRTCPPAHVGAGRRCCQDVEHAHATATEHELGGVGALVERVRHDRAGGDAGGGRAHDRGLDELRTASRADAGGSRDRVDDAALVQEREALGGEGRRLGTRRFRARAEDSLGATGAGAVDDVSGGEAVDVRLVHAARSSSVKASAPSGRAVPRMNSMASPMNDAICARLTEPGPNVVDARALHDVSRPPGG